MRETGIDFPDLIDLNCPLSDQGEIDGYSAHIEAGIINLFGIKNLTLVGRLRGTHSIGRFSTMVFGIKALLDDQMIPVEQAAEHHHQFILESVYFDLLIEKHISSLLMVRVGLSTGYRHYEMVERTVTLIDMPDRRFLNPYDLIPRSNERTTVLPNNQEDEQTLSVGLLGQIAAPIPITDRFSLIPEAAIQYQLAPSPEYPWPATELSAGITAAYTF